jgi:hypothetical protein
MAFVLAPPSTPQFELPLGNHICTRSCSSNSDLGTVRRLVIRNVSPISFAGASPPVLSSINSHKENSPLAGSTTSLINFRLYDGIPVDTSPRRSWSWNVTRDHLGRVVTPPNSSRHDLVSATHDHLDDNSPRCSSLEDLTEIRFFGSIGNLNEEREEEDKLFATPNRSSTPAGSIRSGTAFPDFDGVGHIDFETDNRDQVPEDGRSSPLKRWLRTLRKRNVAETHMLRPTQERWVMDDFDPTPLLTPSRFGRGEMGHRKTLSSVSSSALLSAVKTASVTISSLSIYPRSRRSGPNSWNRLDDSIIDENYGRSSIDNAPDATVAIDDGIWFRYVQRNKIVEEIISSEESYIRDLKTLINVLHLRLISMVTK